MPRTPRIEICTAAGTHISRAHVLVNGQLGATSPAEHGLVLSFMPWPDLGRVMSKRFVAAYTGIVLIATLVLDSDNVPIGVPVGALCQGTDVQALNWWS